MLAQLGCIVKCLLWLCSSVQVIYNTQGRSYKSVSEGAVFSTPSILFLSSPFSPLPSSLTLSLAFPLPQSSGPQMLLASLGTLQCGVHDRKHMFGVSTV